MPASLEDNRFSNYFVGLTFLIAWFGGGTLASDDEYRLLQDLRENYDPVERPVQNHADPVDVHLKILLQQIVDVDEKNQVLTTVIWIQLVITMNIKEYSNITEIQLPPGSLWSPDIILFNSADEKFDARFPVNFVVKHTGDVLQAPPAIVKSSCEIDITWFPFDEQLCNLKYGSWTYTGRKLRLFIDDVSSDGINSMDLQYYIPNGEWELMATPAVKKTSMFDNEPYIELFFFIHIRRKTIYYGMNWIIPSVLFLLSNVLGFTMPAECGEKITLQTTNLLSVTVFLGMVADVTPPTSTSVPIIAAFFSISMVLLGSSIIFTLLIINVHFRSPRTHKMSPWVRTLFLEWLPWLLLMNRPGRQFKNPKKKQSHADNASVAAQSKRLIMISQSSRAGLNRVDSADSTIAPTAGVRYQLSTATAASMADGAERTSLLGGTSRGTLSVVAQDRSSSSTAQQAKSSSMLLARKEKHNPMSETTILLRRTMRELSEYLHISLLKMEEEEEEEEAQADWRFMAMALDRACLFLYALLSFLIPIWMFLSAPPGSPVDGLRANEGNGTALTA